MQQKSLPHRRDLKDTDWAWLAGIIEGEGCIGVDNKGRRTGGINVTMTDEDIVRRLYENFGGRLRGPSVPKNSKHKPVWYWTVGKKEHVKPILLVIRPYMGQRRGSRIDELLELYAQLEKEQSTFQHGTRRGYDHFKCKCTLCIAFNSKRARVRRGDYNGERAIVVGCILCKRESSLQSFKNHFNQMHDPSTKSFKYRANRPNYEPNLDMIYSA